MAPLTTSIPIILLQLTTLWTTNARASPYTLDEDYSGADFFNGFDFFTDRDPTNGFVTYVDQSVATGSNLTHVNASGVYMGVDSSTVLNPNGPGRKSVRISTKKSWTHGLFIADIIHMPGVACGTWPAFWSYGPNWPNSGEIDIIEGVNSQQENIMSLHSSPGCTVAGDLQRGQLQTANCDANVNYNSGCSSSAYTTGSYGTGFNKNGGGVFATEWTSDYIRIWFFPRGSIPADITAGEPNPSLWGLPEANFQGDCDIDSKFRDHNLIFDTTFCGDWGNAKWSSDPTCGAKAPTCSEYVAINPEAFAEAYWLIDYVKVYQLRQITEPSNGTATCIPRPTGLSTRAELDSAPIHEVREIKEISSPKLASRNTATGPNSTLPWTPQYYGCFSSPAALDIETTSSAFMTTQLCLNYCVYQDDVITIGLYDDTCYCIGDKLSELTLKSLSECNIPCPGFPDSLCGGNATTSDAKVNRRVDLEGKLLSVYGRAGGFPIPDGSSSSTTSEPTSSVTYCPTISTPVATPTTSVAPASESFGFGMGGTADPSLIYTHVVTTTYVDVCGCAAKTLETQTLTSTITLCSCALGATASPVIPMFTTEKACNACGDDGGASVITVTIPYPCEETDMSDPHTITAEIAATQTHESVPYPTTTLARHTSNGNERLGNGTSRGNQTVYIEANAGESSKELGNSLLFGALGGVVAGVLILL